jgi:hypothetical protein
MEALPPPRPVVDLATKLYYRLVYTPTDLLPPPLDDSPEALRARTFPPSSRSRRCCRSTRTRSIPRVVDPGAEPRQAAVTGAAPVGAPVAAPACGLDQRIAANISKNGINSQEVAFETWMSAQPWNQGSRGSGETDLRAVVREAMAESRLRGQELSANGRESPGMAN